MKTRSLKWYSDLKKARHRKAEGFFLVEGFKSIEQIAQGQPRLIEEILCSVDPPESLRTFPLKQLEPRQIKSIAASATPQGIVAVVRLPDEFYSDTLPENPGTRILYLDDVQDPGNVGTLIRSAAAFNFDGVLLTEGCADPLGPKAVQATSGALGTLWIRKQSDAVASVITLKSAGTHLITADMNGHPPEAMAPLNTPIILAMGNEAAGPSQKIMELTDTAVCIPMNATRIESLNVAVSGGILMYLLRS